MISRVPLTVAVVGALLIGGATTGSTLAVWRDQANLSGSQVTAGELTIMVKDAGETSAALPAISGLVPGGNPVTVTGLIRNASPGAAKNLRVDVNLSDLAVASSPAPTSGFTLANLRVDVRPQPTGGCPILSAAQLSDAAGYATAALNPAPLIADQTVPICVSVAARSTMPTGASGQVSMTFRGVQVP